MPYLWSSAAVAAAVLSGQLLTRLTPVPNLSLVFLLAVLFSALRFGMRPAIYASLVAFLAHNFFFIQPLYTFTVAEPYELLALVIFLVVAVITSALAGRVRDQARIAAQRMRATRRLYEFTRKLSRLASVEAVAEGAAAEIHASLGHPALILLDREGALTLTAAWPPEDAIDAEAMRAAQWACACNEPAGAGTAVSPETPWFFVPLRTQRGSTGAVGVACGTGAALDAEARALLDTLAEQVAAALERASFAREMVSARATAETEHVRNILLASISHDFRTPLASILGSATSLIDFGEKLDTSTQRDLLHQIRQEAEGLDAMVRDLLAITRIDAGGLELRYDWVDLREVAERTVSAARRRGARQSFETALPAGLPLIRADPRLVEQALGNVVSNAVLHTPPETRVTIDAAFDSAAVLLRVTDDGPGIPAKLLPRAFDKFVRSTDERSADRTGLGLAIAKGIVEAHRGSIAAEAPVAHGHGSRIVLSFPVAETSS
jgi:two-component system sensor histidine kinase KdpD